MPMRIGGFLLVSALVGCGPAASSSATRVVTAGDIGAPEGGNGNGAEAPATTDDGAASTQTMPAELTAQEILVSGRGFSPQPAIRTGAAGAAVGGVDGSSLSAECVGTFPSSPQHVIKLGGPIDLLRILVDSDGNDLTLAVRTPDGVYHCNDDSGDPMNGLNPTVELYSPVPGTIEVWVGTYSEYYTGAQYRLGVTEQSGYASDILRH
jgi:hypothetical protein